MFVSEIHVFPVKAMGGIAPDHAVVEPWGLQQDRRWMVVDPDGHFITQREQARLALIQPRLAPGVLSLRLDGHGAIDIAEPDSDAPIIATRIWRDHVPARRAGGRADDWISAALGLHCRLVHLADPRLRAIAPSHGRPGESVSFADGFPVLLASTASLADLNVRLASPIPMSRFRPNIVVSGAQPWAEDGWRRIRIGGAILRVAKPCARCVVTTIDQRTGERPDKAEPLRALGLFRRDPHGLMFGQNLVPETGGRVALGDAIEVLDAGPPNVRPIGPADPPLLPERG